MAQPSKTLELLALNALKAKQRADEAVDAAKEAQAKFIAQCIAEDMFNQDTKAIGAVRTVFTPNRYFDLDTAITILPEEVVEECKVTVVDPKLLQQHMTPIQKEAAMKEHAVPLKVGLKVNA